MHIDHVTFIKAEKGLFGYCKGNPTDLHRGDVALVTGKDGDGGGGLCTPHPHSFVEAPRCYHGVVNREGDVRHLGRVAPQSGQQLS